VSWLDVAGPGGFLDRLNQHLAATAQAGAGTVRLPTEAEWENAARAQTTTRFPFGDAIECDDACGACAEAAAAMWWCGSASGTHHSAGALQVNGFSLADTQGNVWEWVADWWGPYREVAQTDPPGPAAGTYRVLRGGDSFSPAADCRVARRDYQAPGTHSASVGFRLARSE
jgi:formylglycine-generating enzyme